MTSKSRSKRLPVDLQRDLVDVALLHLLLDGSWECKDLGGEAHQFSELARQYVVDLLRQLLEGKRPYLPKPTRKSRLSADERYVSLIGKALATGAMTMEEAYVKAAGASKTLAGGTHDARIREAKRSWQAHWLSRSEALGVGHRLRPVPSEEMREWITTAHTGKSTNRRRRK